MQWGYHYRKLTKMGRSHLPVTCRGADPHGRRAVKPLFFNLPVTCRGEGNRSMQASSFEPLPPPSDQNKLVGEKRGQHETELQRFKNSVNEAELDTGKAPI